MYVCHVVGPGETHAALWSSVPVRVSLRLGNDCGQKVILRKPAILQPNGHRKWKSVLMNYDSYTPFSSAE
jgi:hypothetical protein